MKFKNSFVEGLSKAFDSQWDGLKGDKVLLKDKDLSVTIYKDDGCRITNLIFKDVELLRQHTPDKKAFQYGCFPMVPWVGRLKNGEFNVKDKSYFLYQNKGKNAMHGMAHFFDWDLTFFDGKTAKFETEIKEPWPFICKVEHIIQLQDNCLYLTLKIKTDKDEFPVDAGWHPWFLKQPKGDNTEVELYFEPTSMQITGDDEIPTNESIKKPEGPWDDTFNFKDFNASAKLLYPNKREIVITSNCPNLTVFNKQPDALCVNTMTNLPNGLNSNPNFISPIKELVAKSIWTFK